MSKLIFIFCFFSFSSLADITTLSKFQKSVHVIVVQAEKPLFDSGYWKVKVIDLWTDTELPSDYFYTLLSEDARGKMFVGTYGSSDPKTLGDRFKSLIRVNSHNKDYVKQTQGIAERVSESEKKGIYLHPWYDWSSWPVLKDSSDELYIPRCIDGLTDKPLINPSLGLVKKLALPKINKPPHVKPVGLFWPAGEVDDFNGLRCESSDFDKTIFWIKSLF